MSEILGLRLLAFHISFNTVNQAQIRWYPDGQTMVYRDIKLSLVQLNDWVDQELESARIIFHQYLCFDYEDIPTYRPANLQNNWDASEPGD
jgi:hypothetical protein